MIKKVDIKMVHRRNKGRKPRIGYRLIWWVWVGKEIKSHRISKSQVDANDDIRKVNIYLQIVLKGKEYSHPEPVEW